MFLKVFFFLDEEIFAEKISTVQTEMCILLLNLFSLILISPNLLGGYSLLSDFINFTMKSFSPPNRYQIFQY